jgi:WD40 repeat protein
MLTMAIAPDSKSLVTCHGDSDSLLGVMPGDPEGGGVILWDLNVTPPKPKAVFGDFKYDPMFWMTRSAAFSRDGKLLAFAARQNRVETWDVSLDPPNKVSELPGYMGQSGTVAFAPDDQTLASVGAGVVLWDLTIAPPDLRSSSAPLARSEFLSPDGRRLAKEESSGDGPTTTTRIWDLSRPVPTPLAEIRSGNPLGFGADGMLVTMDHAAVQAIPESPEDLDNAPPSFPSSLRRWDVSGTTPRDAGTISLPSLSDFTPRPIAFGAGVRTSRSSVFPGENRDGELMLLRLIDHRDAKFCKLPIPRESELYPSAVSAKGNVFAAAIGEYGNRIIKVWDITRDEAQERASIQPAKIPTRVQGTLPDGTVFDGGPEEPRPFNVWGISLAADGAMIALADVGGNIQIWSVAGAEPKLRATLSGHQQERVMGAVRDLKFSSDAQRLLTIGGDRKLIVWDIVSSQAIYTAVFPDASTMAADFTPDHRHVVTSNPDGTLYVLRLPQGP